MGPRKSPAGRRIKGYAPIRDYAAIGDGRTVALVARDGAVDWLCLPDVHSSSVFGALLDAERGGRFELCPDGPSDVERRYRPGTNLLETAFVTDHGVVRVIDAMTLPRPGLLPPSRELARRNEGLGDACRCAGRAEPRFGYATGRTRIGTRLGVPIATCGGEAVAVSSWDGGVPACDPSGFGARFEGCEGRRTLLGLSAASLEPLVFPGREQVEARLDATGAFWRRWTDERPYAGPWRDEVLRSALSQAARVRAVGRDRRGADHVAPGVDRRGA